MSNLKLDNKIFYLSLAVILMGVFEIYSLTDEYMEDFKNSNENCIRSKVKIQTTVWATAMWITLQLIYGASKVRIK